VRAWGLAEMCRSILHRLTAAATGDFGHLGIH
jgi:hypothetical protein